MTQRKRGLNQPISCLGRASTLPDWFVIEVFVASFLAGLCFVAWRNTDRQIHATLVRRRNLMCEEFMGLMTVDAS
jgi:hypothetical protein